MKIKKILFLTVLFLLLFISQSFATAEIIEFDISKIIDSYNNYPYVLALKNIGINVKAVQSGNDFILTYNDTDTVTFTYNEDETMFHTRYPFNNRTNSDILSSIFVDCISNLQGNEIGALLPFYPGDTFGRTFYKNDGISREYLSTQSGGIVVDCKLNPFMKLAIPKDQYVIDEPVFISSKLNFYNSNSCIAKKDGLICYKSVIDDNTYELYIGKPDSLDDSAYYSVVTAVSLLAKHDGIDKQKTTEYLKKNYSGFENGDYEFDGIKIETDITELPIENQDTILVGNNMKYAKITVNKNLLEAKADEIQIKTPTTNDTVKSKSSDNKVVVGIIVIYIVIIAVIGLVVIWSLITRKKQWKFTTRHY